jgi:hypothetical protein
VSVLALIPKARPGVKTFWHMGGDLVWRRSPISVEQALKLRDLYAQTAAEAYEAQNVGEARRAAALYSELTTALDALAHHNRCVGKPSPFPDPKAEVAGRLVASAAVERI